MKVYSNVQGHNFESTTVSVKRAGAINYAESSTGEQEHSCREECKEGSADAPAASSAYGGSVVTTTYSE